MNSPKTCGCSYEHLVKIHRSRWMKLLPWLRRYQCSLCQRRMLARESKVEAEQLRIFYETRQAELERTRL